MRILLSMGSCDPRGLRVVVASRREASRAVRRDAWRGIIERIRRRDGARAVDHTAFVNVISFLGFVIGVPAGIVAGLYRVRTGKIWIFMGLCLALSIVLH